MQETNTNSPVEYQPYQPPSGGEDANIAAENQAMDIANEVGAPVEQSVATTEYQVHENGQTTPDLSETSETPDKKSTPGKAAALAAAVGVSTLAVLPFTGIGDKPEPTPDVEIEAPEEGTAWDLAGDIKDKDASQREVSDAIQEQADKQMDPGVQPGEMFILPDEFVSEEAEKQYAPEEPHDK